MMQRIPDAIRKGSTPMSISRAAVIAALFVCRVERTRWPVRAASIATWAVSRSRISPTISASGSERTIERRPEAKVTPASVVDVDLLDPVDLVLDRVLDADQGPVGCIELAEQRVQGGRLAGAGRAGGEDRSLNLADRIEYQPLVLLAHAERVKVEHDAVLVEDAHHDRLAADHGEDGDPDVDLAVVDLECDAAVLGDPALRDIELGHDLDAGDEPGHPVVGHRGRIDHDAVHPVANLHRLAPRVEVDVGGAAVDGVGDDRVDELDDRRLLGRRVELDNLALIEAVVWPPRSP